MATLAKELMNRPAIDETRRAIHAALLSQAISGEQVGIANHAAIFELAPSARMRGAIVDGARACEEVINRLRKMAERRDLHIASLSDVGQWAALRRLFDGYVADKDLRACRIIQDIMLQAFATALYGAFAEMDDPALADRFAATASRKQDRLDRAIDEMRVVRLADPARFDALFGQIHGRCMPLLAAMISGRSGEDSNPAAAIMTLLPLVGLDPARIRGRAIRHYLETLDRIGIPGDESLVWVARLPL